VRIENNKLVVLVELDPAADVSDPDLEHSSIIQAIISPTGACLAEYAREAVLSVGSSAPARNGNLPQTLMAAVPLVTIVVHRDPPRVF
jgi:hypothetical protein